MKWISGEELANYAVCPEAWRLKYVQGSSARKAGNPQGTEARKEWTAHAELRHQLKKYTKIIFALLAILTGGILLLDSFGLTPRIARHAVETDQTTGGTVFTVPSEIGFLLLLVGLLIFVWDLFDRRATLIQHNTGLSKNTELLSARGSSMLPARVLRSEARLLSSKPHALLKENRFVIPADIYPMTNKVRDRHVLPLLLHLALVEETEKFRPPYGVLLMGKKRRRVQVVNTDDKQRWLQSVIDEMRSIVRGVPAVPTPAVLKCRHCDVASVCKHAMLDDTTDRSE